MVRYLNWNVLYKLIDKDYVSFYCKISKRKKTFTEFINDMDFLSEKLISIISFIDKKRHLHVLSIYFAILEKDIDDFEKRNIDISRFLIIKDIKKIMIMANQDMDMKNIKEIIGIFLTLNNTNIKNLINKSKIADDNIENFNDILNEVYIDLLPPIKSLYKKKSAEISLEISLFKDAYINDYCKFKLFYLQIQV